MAINFEKSANAARLNSMIAVTDRNKNAIVTQDIDINLIDENPRNEKIFSMEDIDYLAEDIQEEGFQGTIRVYKKKSDGRYEISSGHRRFRAAKASGMSTIPCEVIPEPDEITKLKLLIKSNIQSRRLKPLDYARAISVYMDDIIVKEYGTGRTRTKVAKIFNISETQVQRYMSLLKLIPELQQMANDERFNFAAFASAASISEEEQKQLYNKIVTYMTDNPGDAVSGTRIEGYIADIKRQTNNDIAPSRKISKEIVPEVQVPTTHQMVASVEFVREENNQNDIKKASPNVDDSTTPKDVHSAIYIRKLPDICSELKQTANKKMIEEYISILQNALEILKK